MSHASEVAGGPDDQPMNNAIFLRSQEAFSDLKIRDDAIDVTTRRRRHETLPASQAAVDRLQSRLKFGKTIDLLCLGASVVRQREPAGLAFEMGEEDAPGIQLTGALVIERKPSSMPRAANHAFNSMDRPKARNLTSRLTT
jgi:hypothetical protein